MIERWWPLVFVAVFTAGVFDPASLINVRVSDGVFDWTFGAAAVSSVMLVLMPSSLKVRYGATAVALMLCFTRAFALIFATEGLPSLPLLAVMTWFTLAFSYSAFSAISAVMLEQRKRS